MKIDFAHRQSAHCESGVTSNLLLHRGLEISEALAFGLGSGLFFGYVPTDHQPPAADHLPQRPPGRSSAR